MEIKILQVFYGKDGLPYKDKDRQVHFPIAGTGFLGASNTTKIKFYYDELDNLDETTWVAVSKLPNGKVGSRVLESHLDSELNEHYALLELDNYYTQYKGDVFISLQGYQGGVDFDYDEENSQYEIHGTPTIAATGSIKFTINYANQFVGSGETDNINFQRILAALGTKLGMRAYSEHVEELPSEGSPDVFYVVNDDPNNPNLANIYVWNGNTRHYIWVGDNTLDLGNYYTHEQGDQFEEEIGNRVSSVENELSSVAQGSPKGSYATLSDLETAHPAGDTGIYIIRADNHWYYWDGEQWADGGAYLTSSPDDGFSLTSTNSIQNNIISQEAKDYEIYIRKLGLTPFELLKTVKGWIRTNGTWNLESSGYYIKFVKIESDDIVVIRAKGKGQAGQNNIINYAVLTDYPFIITEGDAAPLSSATGFTGRIDTANCITFTAPEDAEYLAITITNGGADQTPSSILINGIEIVVNSAVDIVKQNTNKDEIKITNKLANSLFASGNGYNFQPEWIIGVCNTGNGAQTDVVQYNTIRKHTPKALQFGFPVILRLFQKGTYQIEVCQIDENGIQTNFILPSNVVGTNYFSQDITIPANTRFKIVFAAKNDATLTSINPNDYLQIINPYVDVNGHLLSSNVYKYTPTWILGTFNQGSGSSTETQITNNLRKNTLPLVFDFDVTINVNNTDYGFNVVLVDDTNMFLGYLPSGSSNYSNAERIIPANTRFRIIFGKKDDSDISSLDPNTIISIENKTIYNVLSYPNTQKWCAMGDSIVEGYYSRTPVGTEEPYALNKEIGWAYKLMKIKGWKQTNIAIGGTGWIRGGDNAGWKVAAGTDFTQFDFVTIAYGVNDWKYDMPLGTFNDDYSAPTTIYGAIRKTLETIITSNPLCKIFVISPINCCVAGNYAGNWGKGYAYPNNGTLTQVCNAIKECCEYYGVEYIDMLDSSIVNRNNIQTCLLDNVHPTPETHTVMAHELAMKIKWE